MNPASLFDVQVKRLHEYKRQLLNALRIIDLYLEAKDDPSLSLPPQTFIFGAKAAPGYYMAKEIIRLIVCLGEEIKKDPAVRDKIAVLFVEDYNVSKAEILMPAAELSEQISLAGKEASGTGNMKLMINGAVTLGTMDGANVEIAREVGEDNIFIFGLKDFEVNKLFQKGYEPISFYQQNPRVKRAVDRLNAGFNGVSFANLQKYLILNSGVSDPYMCLADFASYVDASRRALAVSQDQRRFMQMSLSNIAKAGVFSADRSIGEYAKNVWGLLPIYER